MKFKLFLRRQYMVLSKSFAASIWEKIKSTAQAVVDKIVEIGKAAIDSITSLAVWFVDGVKSIIEYFGSVLAFIKALAVMPLLSFLGAIVDIILSSICSIMTISANSAVSLFKPDIGTGSSLFDLLLKGYSGIIPMMRVISLAFIFIITVSSLCKIMFHSQADETPTSVITGAIVAGIMASCAPFLIVQMEKIFLAIYSGPMSMVPKKANFQLFALAITKHLSATAKFRDFGPQLEGLMITFLLVVLMLMIAWKFVSFLLEIAQRYLVLGMLLIFSPLACCFITTKSMRNSFKAYIRMLASTFILMFMNVFFLALFLKSVTGFSTALNGLRTQYESYTIPAIVVTWCLLVYGLLHVATQFDSYLNTLGFSTAETGSGMMASMLMDAIDVGMVFAPSAQSKKTGKKGFLGRAIARVTNSRQEATEGSARTRRKNKDLPLKAGKVPLPDLIDALRHKTGNDSPIKNGRTATAAANTLLDALKDPKLKNERFERSLFTIDNGMAMIDTVPDKDGKSLTLALAPIENLPRGFVRQYGGREIDIPSQGRFVMLAIGANAAEYLSRSSAAEAAFKKTYGLGNKNTNGQVYAVQDNQGQKTGAYRRNYKNESGVEMMTEWAPVCSFMPDPSLNATQTRVGDLDYWRYDISVPTDSDGHLLRTCDDTVIPTDEIKQREWLRANFMDDIARDKYKLAGGTAEQLFMERGEEKFVMSPIISTSIVEGAEDNQKLVTYYARNGVGYIMAKVDNFEQNTIDKVFMHRTPTQTHTFARARDLDKAMNEALNRRYIDLTPRPTSNIQRTAYNKKGGR